ncbi:alpha-L-rhamnosidase C-terminal domain-containing protein [Brevundimonas sp. SL130]|uniref:alpha-L-rhamnosidase-related protein n=1 Tax=Brevundimonas sp. SL130 TaxID=2995143 RepID=UPI00226CAE1D|nr:alpha-L-rhamnosidase C-terminal domain-containing protein [Brevundimonas sp. SL130]WAC58321.1 hypothetical protein OU998_08705 [Brevundimonas sp. SL130]
MMKPAVWASVLIGAWLTVSSVQAGDWVTHPQARGAAAQTAVNLQFQSVLSLDRRPAELKVAVTADNRFVLYVNGRRVAAGPSRGDLAHWRVASVDLAPYLEAGPNIIAAEVWNDGPNKPMAQVSARTGFRLEAMDAVWADRIDTGRGDWRVRRNDRRTVGDGRSQMAAAVGPSGYYVAGAPETIQGQFQADAWLTTPKTDAEWVAPAPALQAGETSPWTLGADVLPAMRHDEVPIGAVVRATGVDASAFPARPIRVPAHSEVELLIDTGRVLGAYPEFDLAGGAGATIEATYVEALYDANGRRLSDRAAVGDGRALGLTDRFLPVGGEQIFRPAWWRAWRFMQVRIKTDDQPLMLNAVKAYETGYPFETRAWFDSDDVQLNQIWRIGWNTVKFDAHETYMDTAYWEQLQYIGDTRIQALVSYDVSGDSRLAIQAIDAFDASRVVDGLPQAAWPSSGQNSIPPFALLWIGMIHDYWMNQPDLSVVRRNLDGVRAVLNWYAPYVTDKGLVRQTPGWLFIDWRAGLSEQPRSDDPVKPDSCIISLLYLGALVQAAELEGAAGEPERADADRREAERLRLGIRDQCWDATRGLYADSPLKDRFSQHANLLAVLYDVEPTSGQAALIEKIVARNASRSFPEITPVTYYFSFYLSRAVEHAGLADAYLALLQPWRDMLGQNFTTWPEEPDPTRSDSHAWSAHPTSDLLRLVAGVKPDAPGYARVRIEPHLGGLRRLDAATVHPQGVIETRYRVDERTGRLSADVRLPRGLSGVFVWQGRQRLLRPGRNLITMAPAKP